MDRKTEESIQQIGDLAAIIKGIFYAVVTLLIIMSSLVVYNYYKHPEFRSENVMALPTQPLKVEIVNDGDLFNKDNNYYLEIGKKELSESIINQISFNCDEYYSLPLTETRLYINFKVSNTNFGYSLSDLCGIAGREL